MNLPNLENYLRGGGECKRGSIDQQNFFFFSISFINNQVLAGDFSCTSLSFKFERRMHKTTFGSLPKKKSFLFKS